MVNVKPAPEGPSHALPFSLFNWHSLFQIIWAKHNEIQMVNVKTAPEGIADGERIPLAIKELGNCEVNSNFQPSAVSV